MTNIRGAGEYAERERERERERAEKKNAQLPYKVREE
jgi:hypothetical protein